MKSAFPTAIVTVAMAILCGYSVFTSYLQKRRRSQRRRQTAEAPAGRETIFARDCAEFERATAANPRDVFAWRGWGKALAQAAKAQTGAEADRLYAQSEEKFTTAGKLAPLDRAVAANMVGVLMRRGDWHAGEEGRRFLQRACGLTAGMLDLIPAGDTRKHSGVMFLWGKSLEMLGRRTGYAEADRLYAEAEVKYVAALESTPMHAPFAIARAYLLSLRGLENAGDKGRQFLTEARDVYQALIDRNAGDAQALPGRAEVMLFLGLRLPSDEADAIWAEVERNCSSSLSHLPENELLIRVMAMALCQRARLREGEDARAYLQRAEQLVTHSRVTRQGGHLLSVWAWLLDTRSWLIPGEETELRLAEAIRVFQMMEHAGTNPDALLYGWATLLGAQARSAQGDDAARLLRAAKEKLAQAEWRVPGSAALFLASHCARLGEHEECRQWLEKSREPGIRTSRDRLLANEDFAGVRDCGWFRARVDGAPC